MNIALWIVQGLVAAFFLAGGVVKMAQDRKRLADSGLTWVEDFSDGSVKAIGAVEALGAVGLVLPAVTGVAPVLVPLAAVGLGLVMIGAVITHIRRHEPRDILLPAALLAVTAFIAWGRFGPYAF